MNDRLLQKNSSIICFSVLFILLLSSCKVAQQTQVNQSTKPVFLDSAIFAPAHVGIAVYEPATNTYLYNYQAEKYFIPASNTKIFTCYAAMKHLGDSLVGLLYNEDDGEYTVQFTGDPTLLHSDFKLHPVMQFFQKNKNVTVVKSNWKDERWGNGWAWNDFDADYMAERSAAPIYGNVVNFSKKGNQIHVFPKLFKDSLTLYGNVQTGNFSIDRSFNNNNFLLKNSKRKFSNTEIPFVTSEALSVALLEDTLLNTINYLDVETVSQANWKKCYSQPTDSMLKPMMHRSDNFYAEQGLLMVGQALSGELNDAKTIDSLMKTDFANMPNKPRWVDGSGLSRYNLISPMDFVWVLNKMKQEINWNRITAIFPTGNTGTLNGYYKNYVGKIYAKTGTLSNHVALSGFIKTNSGKELIFSVLVNSHQTAASNIRRAVEAFLTDIIEKN
mgnify:CR=1 FL=1